MPSIYFGCQIEDKIAGALQDFRGELESIRLQINEELASLKVDIDQLSGTKALSQVIIGATSDAQILWKAAEAGRAGNEISIQYLYLGPDISGGSLVARPASSSVEGKAITLILPVAADGTISDDVATTLPVWLSNSDVTDLVTGTLVGSGAGFPASQAAIFLEGGKSAPLKDAEEAADSIARPFGHQTYQNLLKELDVPVVDSEEDACSYLNDVDDRYAITNGKLYIVDGENLVGINKLFEVVDEDITELKKTLAIIAGRPEKPTAVITQNVETTVFELVCSEPTPVTTINETFRAVNDRISIVAVRYADGQISALNHYIFWSEAVGTTSQSREFLVGLGYPDIYMPDILSGENPDDSPNTGVTPPEVFVIPDPELLDKLNLTDDEIVDILTQDIDGVKIPRDVPFEEQSQALQDILDNDQNLLDSGLNSGIKKPLAAMQCIDMPKSMDDTDLSKELLEKGKACARQDKNFDNSSPATSGLDKPNLPSADLPSGAAQIESTFAAISSAVSIANRVFDATIGGLIDVVSGLVNSLSNLLSLADNLFKNDLASCLLGAVGAATGLPVAPGVGSGAATGAGTSSLPTAGGLSLPKFLLVAALEELSVSLDETITSALETVMGLIRLPICLLQNLINTILGFDLGGLTNPCKEGNDLSDTCPEEDVQEVINASDEISSTLDDIDHLADEATETVVTTVTESIEALTGEVIKTATDTTQEINRGVQKVMEDIQKSVQSKVKFIDKIDQALKALTGDFREQRAIVEEESSGVSDCASPTLGLFMDAVTAFL
jgi:hypothetical protein